MGWFSPRSRGWGDRSHACRRIRDAYGTCHYAYLISAIMLLLGAGLAMIVKTRSPRAAPPFAGPDQRSRVA